MAVIVEVQPDEQPTKPAGRDGRFTTEQKGKNVAQEHSQREFITQFVAHTPEPESEQRSRRTHVKRETAHDGRAPGPSQTRSKTAATFKRESSQVPDGGWFRATTEAGDGGGRGPPSSSSSSSSSSEDSDCSDSNSNSEANTTGSSSGSSSSEDDTPTDKTRKSSHAKRHRKRQKEDRKMMRKALSGVKIKTPFVWDGTADLDVFDQWTYEIDTWAELNDLADRVVVKLMIQFMKGDASRFFMRHVATRQADWTVKRLYEALFDYCFPTDYKARLRTRLERSVQGKNRQLAVRFPDVTDFQLVQIFWKGINTYLRVYLIEKGLNPEKTPLDKLEEAYTEARREERAFSGQVPGRSWGRFGTRSEDPEPYQGEKSRVAREPAKTNQRDMRGHQSDSRKDHYTAPKGFRRESERMTKMSREERDRLRAEGRCFTCKETGHQSSNCPTRKTAKAPRVPGLQAGAVNFQDLERLAEQARLSKDSPLFVGCMSLPRERTETATSGGRQEGVSTSSDRSDSGIWSRAHTDDCIQYLQVLFQSYHEFELLRYSVDIYGGPDEFLVTDRRAAVGIPDEYVVTRRDLDDPDWNVSTAIQREWNAWITIPPRPEWGTGFPPCDASKESWPALYWLRAHVAAVLDSSHPAVPGRSQLVRVEIHESGYVATSELNSEEYIFTHEEISDPSFDPAAIVPMVLDGYSTDELWHVWRAGERRRRRRMKLMACAVRPKGGRKPSSRPRQTEGAGSPARVAQALERNAMRPKDYTRVAPMPIIVNIEINGSPARALLDTGCMADFISTTLVDQLQIQTEVSRYKALDQRSVECAPQISSTRRYPASGGSMSLT
ncbi:hypothetical protein FKP32DRAFT_1695592 [Trametes sanguinea]|nr:hypothetical protein FKP32DRAFT_1695592 [Trametes sanguinea]